MSIPASRLVTVIPSVVEAGSSNLALNGLFLTQNALMPSNSVLGFASSLAVGNFFGTASDEYSLALIYFAGYQGMTSKPQTMYFCAYNAAARAAWLQSASLADMTLTQLKAITPAVLTITVDGVVKTSASINLSAATSFSNAATLIAAAFTSGPTVVYQSTNNTFLFTSTTTGAASTMSFGSGDMATSLRLTQALGALTSQGGVADTPASALTMATNKNQNFATITPMFEPNLADKQGFWAWSSAQNFRYGVNLYDTDPQAIVDGSTTCIGAIAKAQNYNGGWVTSGDANFAANNGLTLFTAVRNVATFVAGAIASINFSQTNGRITLAYRIANSASVIPTVDDDQLSQNLKNNGYNMYGEFATAAGNFDCYWNGYMPGEWNWIDPFINQIYLNARFQVVLVNLMIALGSIPYNPDGYASIRNTMQDPITEAINFGSIRTGVTLSAAQINDINLQAGQDISKIIQTQGYFLQILDPGADIRAVRGTPVINFWYTDGGSVQFIQMSSINIQ